MAEIAGAKPAIGGDGLGGLFRLVKIALHDVGAADQDFTCGAARLLGLAFIADHHLVADCDSRRSDLAGGGRHRVGQNLRACFRQAHRFDDRNSKPLFKAAVDIRRQGC